MAHFWVPDPASDWRIVLLDGADWVLSHAGPVPQAIEQVCGCCKRIMPVSGFDMTEWLKEDSLSKEEKRKTLASLGLLAGDIFALQGTAGEAHFEIGQWARNGPSKHEEPLAALSFL